MGANDEATVYLFAKDERGFLKALHQGEKLAIRLDILPENAKDGEGFETAATFDIDRLGEVLEEAGPACRL